jgi:hypothetical protein
MAKSKRYLALGMLAVAALLPAEVLAGPWHSSPPDSGLPCAAPYYSTCHYWTPLLYRFSAKCYYGVCGHQYSLDYYPVAPPGEPAMTHSSSGGDKGTSSADTKSPPADKSPETKDR